MRRMVTIIEMCSSWYLAVLLFTVSSASQAPKATQKYLAEET